jgi:hypothetical protein
MLKHLEGAILKRVAIFLILAATFFHLLSVTWLKWGNLFVDSFRDPLVASKILDGKILYRDFFYEYGLFPPYLLAFIYKIFGIHIKTIVSCGISITIAMAVVLYKIARLFVNEVISGLVIVTFFLVFAFGSYDYVGIFNFIFPYSFASVFFIFFIALSVYFFLKFIFSEKENYLTLWSIALSFSFLSRIAMTLPVWIGFMLVGYIFIFNNKNRKKLSLYFFAPLVISTLVYSGFLQHYQAFAGFKESIITHVLNANYNFHVLSGMKYLHQNSTFLSKSFLLHIGTITLLAIGSYIISSFFLNKKPPLVLLFSGSILIGVVFGIAKIFFWIAPKLLENSLQYRCLPLILITGMAISFRTVNKSSNYKKNLALFTLFFISLLTIIRLFFQTHHTRYGFYLLNLGLVSYYIFFFELLKRWLQRHIKKFPARLFTSALICFFITLSLCWWKISSRLYNLKTFTIRTERGNIAMHNDNITNLCWKTIKYLRENTDSNDTLIVIPEGGGINFFSQRENPLRYFGIQPNLFNITEEDEIINEFLKSNVDYVVIVKHNLLKYRHPQFGVHYGRKLFSWIKENYQLKKLIGPKPLTPDKFGIVILKNKNRFPLSFNPNFAVGTLPSG